MKERFIVVYDYGAGGIWRYLWARSRAEIEARYPRLTVVESPPPPWVAELERDAPFPELDIDDDADGWWLKTMGSGS